MSAGSNARWASGWPLAAALAASTLLAVLGVYHETVISMVAIWLRSDTFAHGLIVIPVSVFLVWRRRDVLRSLQPSPDPRGLALLATLVLVWVLSVLADVLVIQQFALVAMVPALLWTLLGQRIVSAIAFPLAFLLFSVPFGEGLVPHLMEFTARVTVRALEISQIPVYREGFLISIPSGDFEVARACSGIRYLIASLALGVLFAFLTYHSPWRRAGFIALAVIVPIFANGLRAYGIVLLAHLSDMRIAVGVDHLIYGWIFFGIVMFLLFTIGMSFRDRPRPGTPPARAASPPPGKPDARVSGGGLVALALAVVVLLSAGPITAARLEATAAAPGLVPGLPEASESWRGPLPSAATWRPLYTGPDAELEARYLHGTTDAVEVRVVWYRSQRQGAELINFENRLFDKGLWQEVGETTRAAGANGTNLRVIEKRLRNGQQQLRLWYWYLVGGAHATSETSAKLLEIPAAFREPHVGSALIAIAAREDSGNETAESLLGMFLEQHYAALQRCVTGANEGCQQ